MGGLGRLGLGVRGVQAAGFRVLRMWSTGVEPSKWKFCGAGARVTAMVVCAAAGVLVSGCERSGTPQEVRVVRAGATDEGVSKAGTSAAAKEIAKHGAGDAQAVAVDSSSVAAERSGGGQRSAMPSEPKTPAVELVPVTISIDGIEVSLDVYAWRNLMPMVVEEAGEPSPETLTEPGGMLVRLALKPAGTAAGTTVKLPEGTDLSYVELRQSEKVWTGTPVNEGEPTAAVARMVRGGPKWVPGDGTMTVVVRVTAPDGQTLYVKAEGVVVEEVH